MRMLGALQRIIAPVFCDTSYLPTTGMKISRLSLHIPRGKESLADLSYISRVVFSHITDDFSYVEVRNKRT